MPPYNFTVALLQGLPETLALVFLAYTLLGVKAHPGRIFLLGLLSLVLIITVRTVGAPFPAHALFSLIVMSIIISLWEKIALQKTILAWAATLLALIIFETGLSTVTFHIIGLTAKELSAWPLLWALIGWPHIIAMALLAFWIRRRGGIKFFKGASG